MNFAQRAVFLAAALALCSCSSVDMDAMDKTLHHTPEKDAAVAQEQSARKEYDDRYEGKSPYDYYRSKGFSDEKARRAATDDLYFSDPGNISAWSNAKSYSP